MTADDLTSEKARGEKEAVIYNHALLSGVMHCMPNQAFSMFSLVPSPSHSFLLLPFVSPFILPPSAHSRGYNK